MVKNPPANARDAGLIPGSGGSPGEGNGNSLQCSCLENPMDRGAWQAADHGVAKVAYDLGSKPPNGKEIQGKRDILMSPVYLAPVISPHFSLTVPSGRWKLFE